MSKKQNYSQYGRDLIWVQPYPLKVGSHRLGGEMLTTAPWNMSSIVVGVVQTSPDKTKRAIALREDGPPFEYQTLAFDYLEEDEPLDRESVTVLDPDSFDAFVRTYVAGVNNLDALRGVVAAIEKYAPAFRFMPPHLHYLLDLARDNEQEKLGFKQSQSPYRHLPRMFLRYDFTDYEALVWLDRAQGQVSPKMLPKWHINPDNIMHVGGAWYAFRSLDEAVGAKFFAPKTEIHRLRDDL